MEKNKIELYNIIKLDKAVPIPLYYQLKQYMMAQIDTGIWPVGYRIPAELQMCEKFEISRPTVRQAVNELVSEGYLVRKARVVTVSKPKMDAQFFNKLQSFHKEMQDKNLRASTKVLSLEIKTNDEAGKKLRLGHDEKCIYLERLRFANDEPIVLVETFIPHRQYSRLLDINFEEVSLYETIEKEYNMQIMKVDRTFEAVAANNKESDYLAIKKNSPICFVKTIAYNQFDEPVEFSIARYRGDKSKFQVRIER